MTENINAIEKALRHVPEYQDIQLQDDQVTRLGGMTNLVYRVQFPGRAVIVRIPGKGTEDYIDRAVELHNAIAAANANVSANVIWANADTGIMISECIENIQTMTPDFFASSEGSPKRAALAFKQLHQSGETFKFRFELFSMIDDYLEVLAGKDTDLPEGYAEIVQAAQPIKEILSEKDITLAPCHCDPLCENFLDDGKRMWIVDWEYSGMNDPMWDLGDLSVEAGFSSTQDLEMMNAYFDGKPTQSDFGRMVVYKAMCDLLWTLWGLIQHADKNPAEDFWQYAVDRFERCKKLMNSPEFAKHLEAVRQS